MNKRWVMALLSLMVLGLTGCDSYPYKTDIQEIYDRNNKSGNKAICMMVGDIKRTMYPYTTYHMEGEDLPFSEKTQISFHNRVKNENLHFFTERGFFTEEWVGETDGKPLYRYDLTDLGRQYVDWALGETNFCFGRIVVDSIKRTKDGINGIGGGTIRDVYITYHVENIPDWVKEPAVYQRYRYSEKLITGEKLSGMHSYRVLGNGKLKSIGGVNGRYRWASPNDDEDEKAQQSVD
ncbi:hypothetical protein FPB0191_02312 [Frischella perrara]|uniref:Lipoprotein n=2 Tax=Frischella perrara TaxID=1267021 RepID=A0A0A7S3J3_FRIPE|nr:hypothetical protein [Frischella perrara]AJA46115.1 hypothetical protein FPB0191_02312 [Frischella perrara]